ncbi:MAG: hypothetical protein WBX01_13960 [Nitrososphaeraceae archaeon]
MNESPKDIEEEQRLADIEISEMIDDMVGESCKDEDDEGDSFKKTTATPQANGEGQKQQKMNKKKSHWVYKYSNEIPLAEQIILWNKSVF